MTLSPALIELNNAPQPRAFEQFYGCCHCRRWARDMALSRPFNDVSSVLALADELWGSTTEEEILEAFSGHARIGDMDKLRDKFSGPTRDEQGQVLESNDSVLKDLHRLNKEYENRHSFIFIVCAKGKSAEFMLDKLRDRIDNSRSEELYNGALEQAKITRLRLLQWLQPTTG